MAVNERDVVLMSKDTDGNEYINFPLTRLGMVEDSADIKAVPEEADYLAIADSSNPGTVKKTPVPAIKQALNLQNVDNTKDIDKPVSSLQQAALDKKTDSTSFAEHTGNTTAHVTKSEKDNWNAKLDGAQLKEHEENTTVHVSAEEKNTWNNKADVSAVNVVSEKATANEQAIEQVSQNVSTAQETANAAKVAAQKAQETADAAAEAVTKFTSTIYTIPSQNGILTYTGSAQSPAWNSYDPEKLTIGGTTSGANVGTYSATFTPKEGYEWSDGTKTAKSVNWTISKASLTVPTQRGSLTYTGSAQSPYWSNYNSGKMTLGGTTSGTNAGSYTATFTPGSNYQWSDGTTAARSVTWSIGKAAGSLSIDKSSMALDVSTPTGTITVTRTGDGAVSASSSNTSVATVSVSGTTVTVTAKNKGSATITVKAGTGTNYAAPPDKTCTVTADVPSSILADNTPDMIKKVAEAGLGANYWSVGDKIGIALNGTVGSLPLNDTYYAVILGFNHNSGVEGGNSIHFQFGKTSAGVDIAFCDADYNKSYGNNAHARFVMNTSSTNTGGWNNSYMRKTICPAFLSAMPTAWQNVIASCTKYSDNTGGGSNIASYVDGENDYIWLLSEFEVHGSRSYANSAEKNYQRQYDYYKNGNSKVRYQHSNTGSTCNWWLRSVYSGRSTEFCSVSTSGSAININANYSYGFAPGFMVGVPKSSDPSTDPHPGESSEST